jgi:hypothetical protein
MQEENILLEDPISKNKELNFWMITSVLLFIIVLIGAFIGYKYGNFNGIDSVTLKKKYIEKSKIGFDDLSYDIRNQYINKSNIAYNEANKIKTLTSENIDLKSRIDDLKKELVVAKTKSENKSTVSNNPFSNSEVTQKEAIDLTEKINDYIKDNETLVFIKQTACNDMVPGRYYISAQCREKLKNFLAEFDKDYTFEIIPTVNEDDFVIISKFRDINKTLPLTQQISKDRIDLLNKYANTGLGKFRSNEIGWLIRQMYGKDANLKYVPYHIHAKDDRGIIVKVYK